MVTTEAGENEIVEAIKNEVNNYIVEPFSMDKGDVTIEVAIQVG